LVREPFAFRKGQKILSSNPFSIREKTSGDEGLYARAPVVRRGKGPYVYDYDGNRYVDFDLMNGSLLFGHAPPRVTSTIKGWIGRGYAPGYESASHRTTSKLILEGLLVPAGYRVWGDEKFLYFDDLSVAVATLLNLTVSEANRGAPVFFHGGEDEVPSFYRFLPSRTKYGADLTAGKGTCFMIVRCGRCLGFERVAEIARYGRERGIPLLADISDIASFFHLQHVQNWCESVDALLMGNWITAGLPIGVLMAKQSFLHALGGLDSLYQDDAFLTGEGVPPNYKLRVVQRCVADLNRNGHLQTLMEKSERFYGGLDTKLFEKVDNLIYLKNRTILRGEYDRLRFRFLRGGFLLPRGSTGNLSISFVHSDELLARCARGLNALLNRTH
jgi:hypothetical protein